MALSLFDFKYSSEDVHIFGVLKAGVNQDQIVSILQSDYLSIYTSLNDLLDDSYNLDFGQFCALEQSSDFGVGYNVDFDYDLMTVYTVNNGLGGIPEGLRTDLNTSFISYTISDYKISSGIYSSSSFNPVAFLSDVVVPVSSWVSRNSFVLTLLAVTFVMFGIRSIGRAVRALGRGR